MDVLRKELAAIYAAQNLNAETLDPDIVEQYRITTRQVTITDDDCRVITDASSDRCYIYSGRFAALFGLRGAKSGSPYETDVASSDEDEIYNLMHPEDLVDKRMLEYEFFRLADSRSSDSEKLKCKATCRIRMRANDGKYIYVDNSTQVLHNSPGGKIWLILCRYSLSADQHTDETGIRPVILDTATGTTHIVQLQAKRHRLLTGRERHILSLIRDGMPSKPIAAQLGISINTVNRHRQNILEKLSVGNSIEAVTAATAMKLL